MKFSHVISIACIHDLKYAALTYVDVVKIELEHRRALSPSHEKPVPERTRIVATMLTAARQIAAAEEFAHDAAELVESLENRKAVAALRVMVLSRKTEVAIMRYVMKDLAETLAEMPLEGDWVDGGAGPEGDRDDD